MGSVFAEGIDHLGGHTDLAIIVGPALPEVNALQKKRMEDRKHLGRDPAFEEVYQIPGMQKINQALGRLVRAPGQTARILFHCKRFAETSYQDLLMEDFQSDHTIRNQDDLENWLKNTWNWRFRAFRIAILTIRVPNSRSNSSSINFFQKKLPSS